MDKDIPNRVSESIYKGENRILLKDGHKKAEGHPEVDDAANSSAKDIIENNIFWKMHLMRKEGLEDMDQSVEELVKKCHFWKMQLDAISEQNRQLKLEEQSLRKDYEDLLDKTRNNTEIIINLEDSENKFIKESEDYSVEAQRLEASYYVNVDLSSHRILLENDKKELLQNLKADNDQLARVNRLHRRLQEALVQEKKSAEVNQKRYDRELETYRDSLAEDLEVLEDVKEAFAQRESVRESLNDLITNGVKAYLKLNTQDRNEEKDAQTPLPKEVSDTANLETGPPRSEESSNATEDDQDTNGSQVEEVESQVEEVESQVEEVESQVEEALPDRLTQSLTLFEASQKENAQLQQIYSVLNNRMKELNDLYIDNNELCNLKGAELQKVAEKASDLFQLILQKRKKFVMPQRKLTDELDIKIRNQVQRKEALNRLIAMFLSFNSEDSQLYRKFTTDTQEIYRSALVNESGRRNDESKADADELQNENSS